MPTTKKRVQIPISDQAFKELTRMAKARGVTVSSLSHDLLEEALELQEDTYFSRHGDNALENMKEKELVSHDDAWS